MFAAYELNGVNEERQIYIHHFLQKLVGLGGIGVTCSLQGPRFAGSNPAEIDGFFQNVKLLSTSLPGGTLS